MMTSFKDDTLKIRYDDTIGTIAAIETTSTPTVNQIVKVPSRHLGNVFKIRLFLGHSCVWLVLQ